MFYYHGCESEGLGGWERGVVYVKEKFKASRGFDFLSFVVAWMDGGYWKPTLLLWLQVGFKIGVYCTLYEWNFLSSV